MSVEYLVISTTENSHIKELRASGYISIFNTHIIVKNIRIGPFHTLKTSG